MEDVQRWTVTYTKHVKQKRKVYQDGVLELQSSRRKVILYDEGDILLESRFVKKDDVVKSGETLAFGSYLVDIGELCGGHKPTSTLPCEERDITATDKPLSSHSHGCYGNLTSVGRKPMFGMVKGRKVNLRPPSENVKREFRFREIKKYGSSPSSVDMIKSSTTEWQVLYTTQVTQKAKKFHDGFLQLLVQGSLGRQVMLYDLTRRILESRFLKKHEIVGSGESLAFEGHLVEIGEQIGDRKVVTDSRFQGQDCKIVGNSDIANSQATLPTNKNIRVGPVSRMRLGNTAMSSQCPPMVTPIDENVNLSRGSNTDKPTRAVHTILSVLRKPILIKEDTLNKKSMGEQHVEECNGNSQAELREENSDHDCQIKVLKPETNEVLATAEKCTFQHKGRECHAGSSSNLSSGTTYCIPLVLSVDIDQNEALPNSFSVETHPPMAPGSNEYIETENPPETFSEMITETKGAATIGFSASKFPEDDCPKEMDDYPSFDLGI